MGQYVSENLGKDEQVLHEAHLHWVIFFSLKAVLTLFIAPTIARMTSEFAITNRRVIVKTGLISRHTLEMSISKIESVNVNQSILGRLFNYGTVVLIGSGGTKEVLPYIANPINFRRMFQELQT